MDLYSQASNAFKIDKVWKESGDASMKAGEMALKVRGPLHAQRCALLMPHTARREGRRGEPFLDGEQELQADQPGASVAFGFVCSALELTSPGHAQSLSTPCNRRSRSSQSVGAFAKLQIARKTSRRSTSRKAATSMRR